MERSTAATGLGPSPHDDLAYKRLLAIVPAGNGQCAALAQSVALARRCQAELLLHAFTHAAGAESPGRDGRPPDDDSWLAATITLLQSEGLRISGRLITDQPGHEAMLADIVSIRPDLVIKEMGRESGLRRLFSTPEDRHLARSSAAPLMIVGQGSAQLPTRLIAAVETSGLDDVESTNARVVSEALRLAASTGAELHMAHAIEPVITVPEDASLQSAAAAPVLTEELQALHRQRFEAIARRYDIPATRQHLVMGPIDAALEDLGERIGAELVVVGHHGRTGFQRLLLGSTSEHLLSHGKLGVLVARP